MFCTEAIVKSLTERNEECSFSFLIVAMYVIYGNVCQSLAVRREMLLFQERHFITRKPFNHATNRSVE